MVVDGCPNGCVDGWIINPYENKRVLCPHCRNKRASEVKERGDVCEVLHLPEKYIHTRFDFESVLPMKSRGVLEESSIVEVKEYMENLVSGVSVGELPDESVLINLGISVYEENLIYHLVTKGYIAGLNTLPVLEVPDIMAERCKYSRGESENEFTKYLKADLCMVSIDAGTDKDGILAVKGLMQLRARRYKPTIMLTHVWNKYVGNLINEDEDYKTYELARLVSVRYKKSKQSRGTAFGKGFEDGVTSYGIQ